MTEPYSNGRVPRRHRRILLVLLTGASNLSGGTIWRFTGGSSRLVYRVLFELERGGWAVSEWDPAVPAETRWRADPRRRFYHLTDEGRANVMRLLGLQEPSPTPGPHRSMP